MAEENDRSGRGSDDEDDAEEEFDDTTYKTLKDAVLFAIDVSETMLQASYSSEDKKAAQDSPTTAALKCAYQLMQQRIISNPNDMMGILLFGTKESRFLVGNETGSGGLSYPHCYLLTDLDVPAASDVRRLRNLVEGGEDAASILVPSEEPVSMANVLFCANQIFTTKAPNFSSRRLFLVTDNDDPHGNDKALRSAAAVRAKDLYDLGVTIELFPVAKPGHGFDRTAFYDDIVYRGPVTDLDAPAPVSSAAKPSGSGDGITLLQSLLSSINSKAAPRRALFSLPMEIGPNLKIGVKGYIIIKRQEPVRSCYVWLGGETVQLAVGSSTQIAEDTARNIESADVRRAYKFGGETVSFTPEELSAARYFGDPAIRIIGFKPLSTLPLWANVRPPIFVYPSETDYVGSTRTFSALHQSLLQSQKMALAWFIARKNAAPVIAALIPGAEKLNDSGEQVMPPGLWILPLPYADDIRQNPDTVLTKTSDTLTDMMRVVIQQLQLPKAQYDPLKYPNPALQWFYRILQAIALDEDLPDQPEDKTVPRYKQIDKRAGHYVIEWGQELEQEFQALHTAKFKGKSSNKRAVDDDTSTHTKRSKTANGAVPAHSSDAVDDSDVKMHYQKGSLNKLTVPILKEWASRKHISISGKKADVIERIEEYFEKK